MNADGEEIATFGRQLSEIMQSTANLALRSLHVASRADHVCPVTLALVFFSHCTNAHIALRAFS